jgi:hypothetical protein
MTVYVEKIDSGQYRWRVKVGENRGAVVKSRHRYKRRAMESGRRLARKRGETLKEQMKAGYWRTVRAY